MFGPLRELNGQQWRAFIAAFLGWTLDAFDFFLVTFVVARIATDFNKAIPEVAFAITITLMLRPLGALLFGMAADKWGRRGPLMASVLIYSVIELVTAFSPNFMIFILLRGLYGIAMGGEWGVGAALALETLPAKARGVASGILQQGYATGYLIAAAVFGLFFEQIGWRGMFIVGAAPALLVLYIRSHVHESPAWTEGQAKPIGERQNLLTSFFKQPLLYVYAIVLMAAFNFLSHGSQDLYPTFLQKQHSFDPHQVAFVTIIANIGAICGGTLFGAISQNFGRKKTIALACILGICTIPLWVGAPSIALLACGGFLIQFFVQGAWGVVPAHLNELSPSGVRGTFPGFTYQLGNLISAASAQWEALYAATLQTPAGGADYGRALMTIMIGVFVAVFVLTIIGPEKRGVSFTDEVTPAA
jgi:SHS family lactate transporter-like MFS transporter